MSSVVTLSLNNSLQELPRLGQAVRDLCKRRRVPNAILYSVNLAVDELFTNVVTHGYEDDESHEISIRIAVSDSSIEIEMIDDGVAFNPWQDAPVPRLDTPLETRAIGGLGLHLVKSLMNSLDYKRSDGRNCIRMRKDYSPAAESAA